MWNSIPGQSCHNVSSNICGHYCNSYSRIVDLGKTNMTVGKIYANKLLYIVRQKQK